MTHEELEKELKNLSDKIDSLQGKELLSKERLIWDAWSKVVDVQMHFNEMVMRVRNIAITLILAVFGAAAYSIQTPLFVNVFGRDIHVALFIIVFGLVGWGALWAMDLGHFHLLLRGAVEKSTEIEEKYKADPLLGDLLGMTKAISKHSRKWRGKPVTAGKKLAWFYSGVLIMGVVLCFIIAQVQRDDVEGKAKEQVIRLLTGGKDEFLIRLEEPNATPLLKSKDALIEKDKAEAMSTMKSPKKPHSERQ